MGKWRQGLKIELGATKQRTILFNLTQEVYQAQPSSSRKNSLVSIFSQFCFIPGEQMSTLWANGDRGLKSTSGQQSSGQILFNLTQEVYQAQPSSSSKKFANVSFFHNFASFQVNKCPLYGQMETGDLTSTSGQQSRRKELFNLTQEVYHSPTILFKKKFAKSAFVSQFCFIPGEQMSTLWANGDRGLKSTSVQQSSGQYSLTSHKKFTQPNHPLQEKIRYVSIFFQFCFIPGEQMSTLWANGNRGLKSTIGATKQRTVLFNLTQEVYPAQPSS